MSHPDDYGLEASMLRLFSREGAVYDYPSAAHKGVPTIALCGGMILSAPTVIIGETYAHRDPYGGAITVCFNSRETLYQAPRNWEDLRAWARQHHTDHLLLPLTRSYYPDLDDVGQALVNCLRYRIKYRDLTDWIKSALDQPTNPITIQFRADDGAELDRIEAYGSIETIAADCARAARSLDSRGIKQWMAHAPALHHRLYGYESDRSIGAYRPSSYWWNPLTSDGWIQYWLS